MAKMKSFAIISLLLLLVVSHQAYSRSIKGDQINLVSDGVDSPNDNMNLSFLEWDRPLSATTETCEPIYGFLPCSTNVFGLLFLIVIYEFLLSVGGRYVGIGSELFFEIIGPGVFGASLFQFLGMIPQIVLVLVSSLSGSRAAAQERATMGMGLVAGTTVMLLTLIWGTSVVLGSYNLSAPNPSPENSENQTKNTSTVGSGVVTDAETSYTARIMLITLIPFLILQLQNIFHSSSGRRVVVLIALIVTIILLFAYVLYQIFRPWIQNRRFEYLMNKYAKDKLLQLLSINGKPDTRKIQQMFAKLDNNKNSSVSAQELRVLLLGVKMDDVDLNTERDIENILSSFDKSGDGRINQDEFIKGMTRLVLDVNNQNPNRTGGTKSENPSRPLVTWVTYLEASFYLIVGIVMLCALSEPLIKSVVSFAQAANLSSFAVSYLAIPFAMNYGAAVQSIIAARQKTQKSISLTLSALYGGVYMNNIIGLIVFLAPVYARDLTSNVSAESFVVLLVCIVMTLLTSFRTIFPRWLGYLVLLLYPISLVLVYVLTSLWG